MAKEKILVIGASGQIGVELTMALRKLYGNAHVVASDLREENELLRGTGPYVSLDVMNKEMLHVQVIRQNITQIYLLAAILSATGEKNPNLAWNLNMQGLLNVLDISREEKIRKVYWPSSIAVFGPTSPKKNCPQQTIIEPITVYGISKYAGEFWCNYYNKRFGVDVRSLRYPGLISYKSEPGGGTTDYAIDIFKCAVENGFYECYLKEDTFLPMMYMPDAIRATIELMEAPADAISVRTSYNVSAISFSPAEIAASIKQHLPFFNIQYQPDYRQAIADSWPQSIDDSIARQNWHWQPEYDLEKLTADMLKNLQDKNLPGSGIKNTGYPGHHNESGVFGSPSSHIAGAHEQPGHELSHNTDDDRKDVHEYSHDTDGDRKDVREYSHDAGGDRKDLNEYSHDACGDRKDVHEYSHDTDGDRKVAHEYSHDAADDRKLPAPPGDFTANEGNNDLHSVPPSAQNNNGGTTNAASSL